MCSKRFGMDVQISVLESPSKFRIRRPILPQKSPTHSSRLMSLKFEFWIINLSSCVWLSRCRMSEREIYRGFAIGSYSRTDRQLVNVLFEEQTCLWSRWACTPSKNRQEIVDEVWQILWCRNDRCLVHWMRDLWDDLIRSLNASMSIGLFYHEKAMVF